MVPLTLLLALFLVIHSSLGTAFPIAKAGCQDRCGDVSIPYPFGIGEGCYLNQSRSFLLECNSSTNVNPPRRPSLWRSPLFITDISLEGQFRIWNYLAHDCYQGNQRSKSNSPWIMIDQPFIFNSTANKFTVIGCDSFAFVQGTSNLRRYTTGCMATCDRKEDVVDGFCSGIGCCQTSIPTGAWQINVTLSSFSNHSLVSSFNPCSSAFVIEEDDFRFSADNLTNLDGVVTLPAVVDWVVEYKTCEEVDETNSSAYVCGENSKCYVTEGALGYRCMCNQGYEGNPYLPSGCQDIDECASPSLHNCPKYSACINSVGNYACNCLQGYHGDGKKDGEGCIANEKSSKKNNWPIYVAVGVSTGTLSVLACCLCLYLEFTRRKANRLREEFFKKNGGLILQQKLTGQVGGTYNTRIFTVEELEKATNDFDESQIIGGGGFGIVFKGELVDETQVAIKRSKGVDQHQVEQFINEVIVLSQINNRNVVKLLGCCLETEVPLLVYEFIENGTLFEHLHNRTKASKLSWSIRLRIASEVAGVLSYLHSIASPPIIHRDIKSANILVDQNYTAKVSDFGISRLLSMDENQVSTVVQGTHGYLDPEYMQTGLLTEKSDVYSFGVVLIELLTGKRVMAPDRPEGERFLSNHFLSSLKEGKMVQILDSNVWQNENIEQLMEVAKIAKSCISVRGEDRPSMKDVERDIGALRMMAQKFEGHAFEIDLTECEALLGVRSKEYVSSTEDIPTCSTDLYPVGYTTMEQMLPVGGGR